MKEATQDVGRQTSRLLWLLDIFVIYGCVLMLLKHDLKQQTPIIPQILWIRNWGTASSGSVPLALLYVAKKLQSSQGSAER